MSIFEKYKNLSSGRSFIENEMRMNRMRQNQVAKPARRIATKVMQVPRLDPKLAVIGSPAVKSKAEKKEEKQMKEVYDKVILNGGKKKTAEEKIMDQVINGK